MKVMIATPYYFPSVGGLESYVQAIATGLSQSGWDVVVVAGDASVSGVLSEKLDGYTVYRLPVMLKLSNTPFNLMWPYMIRRIAAFEKPDVINVHAPVPSMAIDVFAANLGKPIVITYHAGSMKKGHLLADLAISAYERLVMPAMMRKASRIICVSEYVRDNFLSRWTEKVSIVTPAVDTAVFKPSRRKHGRQLVFVGDFRDPRKGLDVLLDAVAGLPDVTLRVVGSGAGVDQTGAYFTGVKRGADLVKEIQQADALVLPSTTDAESFGMVLIEAMACGVPVIGSDIGGIGGVIADGQDGLLVPPGDAKALSGAIHRVLTDRTLATSLSRSGRRKANTEYSWSDRVAATKAVLENSL